MLVQNDPVTASPAASPAASGPPMIQAVTQTAPSRSRTMTFAPSSAPRGEDGPHFANGSSEI